MIFIPKIKKIIIKRKIRNEQWHEMNYLNDRETLEEGGAKNGPCDNGEIVNST